MARPMLRESLSQTSKSFPARRLSAARAVYHRRLRIESLEDRRLLAITVDTLVDEFDGSIIDSDVSLRDAIFAAASGETIDFSVNGTINLTLGELLIDKDLSIVGPGADFLTIDASDSDPTPNSTPIDGDIFNDGDGIRIFLVDDGTSTKRNVSISGLTLTGADIDDFGAAIFSREDLSVVDSVITGNVGGYGGGGIGSYEGNLYVANSTISGNYATYGAGIYQYSESSTVISSNISGNRASGRGGGIWGWYSTINVAQSTISGNSSRLSGGGISSFFTDVFVTESTIDDNHATTPGADGGAIYIGDSGYLSLLSSTISGNSTYNNGGGVSVNGDAVIRHSTFTNNVAGSLGAAVWNDSGSLTISHSILAGNDSALDGDLSPGGGDLDIQFSLIGDNTNSGLTVAPVGSPDEDGNIIGPAGNGINPLLGGLKDNGGPTKTHAPLPGSPVIDAGDADAEAGVDVPDFDQRGNPFVRIFDGDGDLVDRIDMGALESEIVAFVVDTLDDNDDADYGPGELSLREAIDKASLITTSIPLIVFDASIHGGTIELSLGELIIGSSMTIEGPGADLMTIDADGLGRIFNIDDYDGGNLLDATISGLTLTGGDILDSGGAILNSENLTVSDSVISGNDAGYGGGIYNFIGSLQVMRSTISGNGAISSGGGILNAFGNASITDSTLSGNSAGYGGGLYIGGVVDYTTTITNSTISGNTSTLAGGGVYNFQGNLLIQFSTITDNDAPAGLGGGVASWADPFTALTTVRSSIIAGNDGSDLYSDDDILNSFVSDGYNLIGTGDGSSAFTQTGDQTGVTNPMLGPLADNGGSTWTHALLDGSPAIDAGDPLAEAGINGVPEFDQRGTPYDRVRDGGLPGNTAIDIGAFEVQDSVEVGLPGDYNGDGKVSAADYTVWRDTVGSQTDLRADGSGSSSGVPDGIIDDFDYDFWIANYGNSQAEGSGSGAPLQSGISSQVAMAEPVTEPEASASKVLALEPNSPSSSAAPRSRTLPARTSASYAAPNFDQLLLAQSIDRIDDNVFEPETLANLDDQIATDRVEIVEALDLVFESLGVLR